MMVKYSTIKKIETHFDTQSVNLHFIFSTVLFSIIDVYFAKEKITYYNKNNVKNKIKDIFIIYIFYIII